jgi:hypothetical protein
MLESLPGTRSKKVSKVSKANDLLKVSNECQGQVVFNRKIMKMSLDLFGGRASKFFPILGETSIRIYGQI